MPSKILAPHGYSFSSNALKFSPLILASNCQFRYSYGMEKSDPARELFQMQTALDESSCDKTVIINANGNSATGIKRAEANFKGHTDGHAKK
ncbi:MAG TPA: hypothetical protein VKJ65_00735 [Phycisphaerae bacterium]|nr:hypothetical protein [Phycisphaerae bacterium]